MNDHDKGDKTQQLTSTGERVAQSVWRGSYHRNKSVSPQPFACAWPLPSSLKQIAPLPGAMRLLCLRACRPCAKEHG